MKLKDVITLCKKRFSLISSADNDNIEIKAVQIITSTNQVSLPGSICLVPKFDKNFQLDKKCHYLIPADYISYNFKNNVTLYNSQNFLELTLFLQDILTDKEVYFNTTSDISYFLNTHKSLQDICQYISVLFHKPAVFVDELFTVVALYPKEKTGIEPYDIFLESDYRNIDTSKAEANVSEMLYPDIFKSALTAFKPYETACASCPIYSGGKNVGGFAMFAPENDIDQTDLKIIDYIMMLIGSKSILNDAKNKISFNSFYRMLITGKCSSELLNKNASILNIDLEAKYDTIVISTKTVYKSADSIILIIKKYLKTELCGIFDNNFVFTVRDEYLTEEKINYLLEKTKEKDEVISIFDIPFDITKTNVAYDLARKYLNNTACSKQYYKIVFENYESFSNENISNLLFYNKLKTLKIEEYETIREYMYSGQNSIATAHKLNIHRNTLSYRLDKIANTLHIDYSRQDQLSNLFLTLKLID